jgi:23S rRNA (cytosine1962-C5)-methyltransferase
MVISMIAYLHKDRLKTVQRRHPWIFSRAIRRFEGNPGPGDIVTLVSEDGVFLARGLWNPASSIRLRVLTWDDEPIDDDFWARRIRASVSRRGVLHPRAGRRLINAESDFLPGLIVDQYGDWLVTQVLSTGIDQRKGLLAEILADVVKPEGIYERGDADGRKREGLDDVSGVLWGKEPPDLVDIIEDEHQFRVDVRAGHKTGFYLDQRENRRLFAESITPGMRVLNAFAYTGGFAVYAYAAGADSVISVDSSEPSLALAEENLKLNGFGDEPLIAGDVFEVMRDYRDAGEQFDAIILDPPKFAKHPKQVETGLRGYKDINLLAWQLLRPGGLLMTFSCSGSVSTDLFRKVVFGALADAERDAQVLRELQAPPDHPVALTFPEGAYLKGLLCQVL